MCAHGVWTARCLQEFHRACVSRRGNVTLKRRLSSGWNVEATFSRMVGTPFPLALTWMPARRSRIHIFLAQSVRKYAKTVTKFFFAVSFHVNVVYVGSSTGNAIIH